VGKTLAWAGHMVKLNFISYTNLCTPLVDPVGAKWGCRAF